MNLHPMSTIVCGIDVNCTDWYNNYRNFVSIDTVQSSTRLKEHLIIVTASV